MPKNNEQVRGLIAVGAFAIYWFSVIDIADGCRARRLKVGSPLGRIVDEAGDTLCQAHYGLIVAMAIGFDNLYAELFCMIANIVFYSMELKHKVQGKLIMVHGEVGPVEVELVLSLLTLYLGVYGNTFLQASFGETYALAPDSFFALFAEWRLLSIILMPLSLL